MTSGEVAYQSLRVQALSAPKNQLLGLVRGPRHRQLHRVRGRPRMLRADR